MAKFEGEQQKIKIRKNNGEEAVGANLKNMRRNVRWIQPAAELQQNFGIWANSRLYVLEITVQKRTKEGRLQLRLQILLGQVSNQWCSMIYYLAGFLLVSYHVLFIELNFIK
jgi:hypothetical protein